MKKTHDAVVSLGEYTDGEGQTKKRYKNIGTVFTRDDGSQAMKLDTVPLGQDWNGWINFYEPQNQRNERPQQQAPKPQTQNNQSYAQNDDIPF
jgi:hypothetical protein